MQSIKKENGVEASEGRSKSQMSNNVVSDSKVSATSSVAGRRKHEIMNDIKKKLLIKHGDDKYTEMAIDNMLSEFNQKPKITLKVSFIWSSKIFFQLIYQLCRTFHRWKHSCSSKSESWSLVVRATFNKSPSTKGKEVSVQLK